MKKQTNPTIKSYLIRGAFYVLVLVAVCTIPFALAQHGFNGRTTPNTQAARSLTFEDRVAYQRAIEEVYWRNRIWPKENLKRKPSFDEVMSANQIEKKVEDYLRDSEALEAYWQKPITSVQLQAEMERMARDTKQPEVLRELFEALGNDPFLIAECLARPVLTQRLALDLSARDKGQRFALLQTKTGGSKFSITVLGTAIYTLSQIDPCTDDTWSPTSTVNAPSARDGHTAVWTGSEMIIWGGYANSGPPTNTGGRYAPSTDSWTATSATNAPAARAFHTAVWTGSEMIVWGGGGTLNTGGRYNPTADSWTATSTTNVPEGREFHTAVWTGNEMIVWGGSGLKDYLNTGGRYNPSTDTWIATSTTNAPDKRVGHTAVWTDSEMIIWGGDDVNNDVNTGGRYNPNTDSWTATSTVNAPSARDGHTAVWTGSLMIVWAGFHSALVLNSGGQYNPSTDTWSATSITNVPDARDFHTAVWSGTEMIAWGGFDDVHSFFNTGGRYNPSTDSWTATSTTDAASARGLHTAVWTGSEMIIWGGCDVLGCSDLLNTGGKYCAATPTPTPAPLQLRAQRKKPGGMNTVRLNWQGATSASIEIYRNGVLIATTPNAPPFLYTDFTGDTGRAQYTYRVCEAGTQTCSNDLLVRFPR